MFLLYYVWGFFIYLLSLTHNFIEINFLAQNNPFLIRKRTFKYLSYFEKLFLVLFHKKGWFERSIAHLFRMKDIEDYRRKNYPLIYLFHLYLERSEYKIENLNLTVRQYNFYKKSKIFKLKLLQIFQNCFFIRKTNFLKFLMIQDIFFRKYFNTFSSSFFRDYSILNSLKLNIVFNIFLLNAKKKFVVYNLDHWVDWYKYAFNNKIVKNYKAYPVKNIYEEKRKKKDRIYKIQKWLIMVFSYKLRYLKISKFFHKKLINIFMFRHSSANFFKVFFNRRFEKLIKNYYMVRFNDSSVVKYINANELKNYNIFYLRKNKIFNKGRYSRNRQLYRTGVYWCLWLNIIMVYGLYFIFYRFSFNFGYIWWGILILAYSTIFSRIVKYNFFNPYYVYKEFNALQRWYGYIFRVWLHNFELFFRKHFIFINIINFLEIYKNPKFLFIFDNYYYYIAKVFIYWIKKKENMKIIYMWQGMKEIDTSFLRYKTVIHWIKEIYRMFTTW